MASEDERYSREEIAAERAWLLRQARRLGVQEEEAADAVADVLLEALVRPPRRGALRAWLSRALFHRLVNRRRTRTRRERRERLARRVRTVASAMDTSVRRERRAAVLESVLALPLAYREVVVLRYLDGLEPSEIAERLDVTPSTVRTRLARARARLRADLDEHRLGAGAALFALLPGRRTCAATAAAAVLVLVGNRRPEPPEFVLVHGSVQYEIHRTERVAPAVAQQMPGTERVAAVLPE